MAQLIDVPGHGLVEFPDDMSDDAIAEAIQGSAAPVVSAAPPDEPSALNILYNSLPGGLGGEDAIKSLAGGLERGAAATPMVIPNLVNQAVSGPQYLYEGLVGDDRKDFKPWQPFYSSEDVLQMLPESLRPHDAQTPGGVGADMVGQLIGGIGAGKGLQYADKNLTPKISAASKELYKDIRSGNTIPPEQPALPATDLHRASQNAYKVADDVGGILKPQALDKFADEVNSLTPQTAEGKLFAGDSVFTDLAQKAQTLKGRPLTLRAAQEIDEELSNQIDTLIGTGRVTKQAQKVMELQDKFRGIIHGATKDDLVGGVKEGFDAWNDGKALWSAQAKLRDIERIVQRADNMDHPAKAIRTGFNNLMKNDKKFRSYDKETQKLIKKAAKTGVVGDLIGVAGSRLVPIIAGSVGGPKGYVLGSAASMASRGIRTKQQAGRADAVAKSVTKQARPLYEKYNYADGGAVKKNLTAEFLARAKKKA